MHHRIISLALILNPRAKKCRYKQAVNLFLMLSTITRMFYDGFLRCGMHLCRIVHVGSRCIAQREGPLWAGRVTCGKNKKAQLPLTFY